MSLTRSLLLSTYRLLYERAARPLIFRGGVTAAHESMVTWMRRADDSALLMAVARLANRATFEAHPIETGGVSLPYPLILAAGWVKGDGFESEEAALAAARTRNIIPGWRSMSALVGPIEFGSFTRWPRMGNTGTVLWRDAATHSTQNRIGLKNPGAEAAAEFLAARKAHLAPIYGINIAVSPGITNDEQEQQEVLEAFGAFTRRGVNPAWFTLNLSCPNTEDDPTGNQSERKALELTRSVVDALRVAECDAPVWVKIGPTLSQVQVCALMRAFAETGVRAVITTNTMPEPTPDDPSVTAGVAGGRLHRHAVEIAGWAAHERKRHRYPVDVIGCGGIEDRSTYWDFAGYGIPCAQYLSALIYRGPLAAALIERETLHG